MKIIYYILISLLIFSCNTPNEPTPSTTPPIQTQSLKEVTVADFKQFIDATGYQTDAEKFGWSIVQITVHRYDILYGATWLKPDGTTSSKMDAPVTQVSYNDALAYCEWANVTLPSYEEYWKLVETDKRPIHIHSDHILPAQEANFVGNTWDITSTSNSKKEVRLAGGSYLCSKTTCDGTNPKRELYVSPDTGNTNISFSVLMPKSR